MAVDTPVAVPRFQLRPTGPVEPLNQRLLTLAGVGGVGLALAAVYKVSGGRIGVPCILHATTGLNCPFCGTTRMAAALLRGDPQAAWAFNPPMAVIAPAVGVVVGYQLTAWTLERAHWLKIPRLHMSEKTEHITTWTFLVGMLIYGVLRNLV